MTKQWSLKSADKEYALFCNLKKLTTFELLFENTQLNGYL